MRSSGEDLADETLAGVIGGMRLAGKQYLKSADPLRDCDQAGCIVEEQIGALIGCDAASKAKGEDVRIEVLSCAGGDLGEEAELALAMSGRDIRGRDAVGGAEVLVVRPPRRNLRVEQLLEGLGEPRRSVYTGGDGVDLVVGNICCETMPCCIATPLT